MSNRADTASSVVDQTRAEPVDRGPADDRRDVLGRLQRAVVGQLDQVAGADRRVGAEEQRDVDDAGVERLVGERATGVEGHDLGELDAVDLAQAVEAQRPGRALGRSTEGQLPRDAPAGRSAASSPRRSATARRTTKAFASCAGARARGHWATFPASASDQRGVGGRDIGLGTARRRGSGTAPRCRRTPAPRRRVPRRSAGATSSRGPSPNARWTGRPARSSACGVDLGEQPALGEVERGDRDRGVVRGDRTSRAPLPTPVTPRSVAARPTDCEYADRTVDASLAAPPRASSTARALSHRSRPSALPCPGRDGASAHDDPSVRTSSPSQQKALRRNRGHPWIGVRVSGDPAAPMRQGRSPMRGSSPRRTIEPCPRRSSPSSAATCC